MSSYTITITLDQPYEDAVPAVRQALGDQGFGILTEIDLRATLKAKLGVDIQPQVILGACRPPLALRSHSGRAVDRDGAAVQRGGARSRRIVDRR